MIGIEWRSCWWTIWTRQGTEWRYLLIIAAHKLSSKYFSPNEVIEKIGQIAFRLQLPFMAKIHDHNSKRYEGKHAHQVQNDLPSFWELKPKESTAILERRRMIKRGNHAVTQVLVKWKGEEEADATWEDFQLMKEKFPVCSTSWSTLILEREGCQGPCLEPWPRRSSYDCPQEWAGGLELDGDGPVHLPHRWRTPTSENGEGPLGPTGFVTLTWK